MGEFHYIKWIIFHTLEYIGVNLHDLVVSNGFLDIIPQVQATKVKIDNRYNEILFSHKKEIKFWSMLQHGWTLKTLC